MRTIFDKHQIPNSNQKYLKIFLLPIGEKGDLQLILMVVIPAVGALLRPLSFIIGAAYSLSKGWVGHIQKTEEKAT